MTDELVDCYNCGRSNPAWAQVCRSCGVQLRPGETLATPVGRFPTDQASLVGIGAALGTILLAVVVGLFLASLNPTDPTIGLEPSPTASPTPVATPTATPAPTDTPAPTATPAPSLPGTVAFGTALDGNGQVSEPADTFTPGMTFAHSIAMSEPFGVDAVGEQVVRVAEDGTETEVVPAAGNTLRVDPSGTGAGVVCCDARDLIAELGPGQYILRVFRGEEVIAEGGFRLSEG